MSKLKDIETALFKANAALAAVYQTVKRGGNPGELRLVDEATAALVGVLFEPAEIEEWKGTKRESGR